MSYEWGNDTMPAPPFDGQLHVDSTGVIREYVASLGAWRDRGDYQLVQSMSQEAPVAGHGTSSDFWQYVASKNSNMWDTIFNRTLVKITWTSTNLVQYVAHVTYAELRAFMAANGPQSGGVFTSDALIEAMEVVSPEMRITRVMSMHRLYGSLRGRKCYQGAYGRSGGDTEVGLYKQAGYGTRFSGYWTGGPTMVSDLVNRMYGQTPGSNEPRCIWFPSAKPAGRYRMGPNVYLGNGHNGRMCWDTATQTYVTAPNGVYSEDTGVASGVRPTWAVVDEPSGNSFTFEGRTDTVLRGSGWLWDRKSIMMLLPLVNQTGSPTLRSFLAYPVGVTHVTFVVPQAIGAASDFIVDNHYDNSSQTSWRWKVGAPSVENPTPDKFRVGLVDALRLLGSPGDIQRRPLDYEGVPSRLQFYIRNPVTGLRSACADREIVKVTRKKHMQLGFFEKSMVR